MPNHPSDAGHLIAPDAKIHVRDDTTWRGRLLAEDVRLQRGMTVSAKTTFAKAAPPEDIVQDPDGGTYPVNIVLVDFLDGTPTRDVATLVQFLDGRIVGSVPSISLFQLEVPTSSINALENSLELARSRQDLGVDGVLRDFIALDSNLE